MGKYIDETGHRYGRLTVLRLDGPAKNGSLRWFCQCDCGTVKSIDGASLRSGATRSCGCIHTAPRRDLTGWKFGKLLVVRLLDQRCNGAVIWECVCDCGIVKSVRSRSLLYDGMRSCGCTSNTRRKLIEHDGVTQNINEWAACIGINPRCVSRRLNHGQTIGSIIADKQNRVFLKQTLSEMETVATEAKP